MGGAMDAAALGHWQALGAAYREQESFPSSVVIEARLPSGQLVEDMLQKLELCGLGLE